MDFKFKAYKRVRKINRSKVKDEGKNRQENNSEGTDIKTTEKIRQRKRKKRLSVCQKQQTVHLAVKGDKPIKRKI